MQPKEFFSNKKLDDGIFESSQKIGIKRELLFSRVFGCLMTES
jgi:hypothetical protein